MENVNQHSNEENPIDYQREFRIIEFKFIVCISFAYTCLYAIGIVILRNIVDKYIHVTVTCTCMLMKTTMFFSHILSTHMKYIRFSKI